MLQRYNSRILGERKNNRETPKKKKETATLFLNE